jgi:hypothetical protein
MHWSLTQLVGFFIDLTIFSFSDLIGLDNQDRKRFEIQIITAKTLI